MGIFSRTRQRLFARAYDGVTSKYERHVAERKRELFEGLNGSVLEIGPGTGANLTYLPPDVHWVGVDPNPFMHERLLARAKTLGLDPEVRLGTAEKLPAEDGSMDVIVSTLVLCSVPEPELALAEIRRVLRPGGRFLFIEHVGAPRGSWLRGAQRIARPFWKLMADGCCPDRDTAAQIRSAAFSSVDLAEHRMPLRITGPIVAPHIAGSATG